MSDDDARAADLLYVQLRALLDAIDSEDEYALALAVSDSEELLREL